MVIEKFNEIAEMVNRLAEAAGFTDRVELIETNTCTKCEAEVKGDEKGECGPCAN